MELANSLNETMTEQDIKEIHPLLEMVIKRAINDWRLLIKSHNNHITIGGYLISFDEIREFLRTDSFMLQEILEKLEAERAEVFDDSV